MMNWDYSKLKDQTTIYRLKFGFMNKLLIATSNPGKLGEIKKYLADIPVELVSLKDIGISDKVEETGSTFEENAVLKAKYYSKLSGLPTIGDDGGFEIDALNGEPGVKSHRWIHGDREDSDDELISYTFQKMKGVSADKRGAQLRAVLAFVKPGEKPVTAEASTRGVIPMSPSARRNKGFPYRSILFLSKINKFYNKHELTEAENEVYNHRRKAINELKPFIIKELC
jgi:XTP/dITP diphosphohydrolase